MLAPTQIHVATLHQEDLLAEAAQAHLVAEARRKPSAVPSAVAALRSPLGAFRGKVRIVRTAIARLTAVPGGT